MKQKPEIIGYVAVDSGQVLLVDPCYLKSWVDGEFGDKYSHYGQACNITSSKKHAGEILVSGIGGVGVVSESGWGDGNYPVIAKRDKKDGRIKSLTIKFF